MDVSTLMIVSVAVKGLYYVNRNQSIFRTTSRDRGHATKEIAPHGCGSLRQRRWSTQRKTDQERFYQGAAEEPRSRVYPWSSCSRATVANGPGSLVLVKKTF